jgi:hypothetical protein
MVCMVTDLAKRLHHFVLILRISNNTESGRSTVESMNPRYKLGV